MDCAVKAGIDRCWIFFAASLITPMGLLQAQPPVEPLLQKYCLGCHNQQSPEAGLSLQTFDAIKHGSDEGPVLDRNNPKAGSLFAVLDPDADHTMPPADEPQPSAAERHQLRQWVLSGAAIRSMAAGIPNVPSIAQRSRHSPQVFSSVAISNKELAVGGSRVIAIRDASTGKQLRKFPIAKANITSLEWGPKRQQLLAAAGLPGIKGFAFLLSPTDGSVTRRFEGHTDALYDAAFSPNEKLVATAGYDRRILIHDATTGNVLQNLRGHNGSIMQLAFDRSGNILCSASTDGTIKVWNVHTGQRLDTLSQPQGEQYTIQISRQANQIFAAGQDNRIRVWKLVSQTEPAINPLLTSTFAHEQTVHRMKLSPDESSLATAAEDGTIRIWSTGSLTQIQTLPTQTSMITSLAFIRHDLLAVTTLDGTTTTHKISARQEAEQVRTDQAVMVEKTATTPTANASAPTNVAESNQQNNTAQTAQNIDVPSTISGIIYEPTGKPDVDCYSFAANAGQKYVIEVNAARKKSQLDSHVQILSVSGKSILRTKLQAVRDSWFTFRGKDGDQSGDFRLFNWREMELNQFLYADGEVTKLHHYPRGPDSGFNVYPGFGKRHTYFGTTATSHALQAPAFVVKPHEPEDTIVSNGLPVFPVFYENDDDGLREFGADSRLFFTPRKSGRYVVRISDAREFSGEDFDYQLTVRPATPSFTVTHNRPKLTVQQGTGTEIEFKLSRIDEFAGPVTIEAQSVPAGYICSTPITIQRDQYRAYATLFATPDATDVSNDELHKIRFVAKSEDPTISSSTEVPAIRELKLKKDARLKVAIHTTAQTEKRNDNSTRDNPRPETQLPIVLSMYPGETIKAHLTLDRVSHKGVVSFGKEDAGRNLPHGVFVDNIGLNGLLLLGDQIEREFFITAAPIAEPGSYTFFLKSNVDGATSYPATLIIEKPLSDEQPKENAAQ